VNAQPPLIVEAKATLKTNQLFDIAVTIRHPDSGWEHYANEWIVESVDGKEIARRTLSHPHVNEQPFTRYVRDVVIPADVKKVTIRAKCNSGDESPAYVLIDRGVKQQDS
tara:strand:- start:131314 stop:131643 length:330 start_codon:yes stop_codon:yes gene_type:complete